MRECLRVASMVVCFASALAGAPQSTGGADPHPALRLVRTPERPAIDGVLDDRVWRLVPVASSFRIAEAGAGRDTTDVRVIIDDTAMYFAFTAVGDGRDRGRDDGSGMEDRIAVMLDPDRDGRSVARFSVTADGAAYDNVGARERWQAATRRTQNGWTAEMAIPLNLLRGGGAQPIDVTFVRYHRGAGEWSRSPMFTSPAVVLAARPRVRVVASRQAQGPQQPPAPRSSPPRRPEPSSRAIPKPPTPTVATPRPMPVPMEAAPVAVVPTRASYVLQPGDSLSIKHFNNPELNELVPIRPDGRLSLDLVGEITAAGLTPSQLQGVLTERYSRLLRDPQVVVIVKEFGGNKIYVGGEVNSPGVFIANAQLSLVQALVEAGGWKRSAEMGNIVILRNQGTSQPLFFTVDLKDLQKGTTRDVQVQPADIIFVPKTRINRLNDFVSQYVNELIPIPVSLGLSYVFDRAIRR